MEEVELDFGCIYLLFNCCNGVVKDEYWVCYFIDKFNVFNLFCFLLEEKIIEFGVLLVYGLKFGWYYYLVVV